MRWGKAQRCKKIPIFLASLTSRWKWTPSPVIVTSFLSLECACLWKRPSQPDFSQPRYHHIFFHFDWDLWIVKVSSFPHLSCPTVVPKGGVINYVLLCIWGHKGLWLFVNFLRPLETLKLAIAKSRSWNIPINKWADEMNSQFSKDKLQMAIKQDLPSLQRSVSYNHTENPFHPS